MSQDVYAYGSIVVIQKTGRRNQMLNNKGVAK